jgi:hypothetical protein
MLFIDIMIAIFVTIYLLLGLTFVASLAIAASRPTPQADNSPAMPIAETNFEANELHDAA